MTKSKKQEKAVIAVQMILDLPYEQRLDVMERVQDTMLKELEVNMWSFLSAYVTQDADAMATAITGWELLDILAKAKVVPDEEHVFYQTGEVCPEELVFQEVIVAPSASARFFKAFHAWR